MMKGLELLRPSSHAASDQVLALVGGGGGGARDDVSVSANETSRKGQTFVEMVEEKRTSVRDTRC